jgi:hypothetical protein
VPPRLISVVESVEKVPKQIFGGDPGKNGFIGCATITDLLLGKGQVTPENRPSICGEGFPTDLLAQNLQFRHWTSDSRLFYKKKLTLEAFSRLPEPSPVIPHMFRCLNIPILL